MGLSKVSDIKKEEKRKSEQRNGDGQIKRKKKKDGHVTLSNKKSKFPADENDENSLFDDEASVSGSSGGSYDSVDETEIDDEMKGFIVDVAEEDDVPSEEGGSDDEDDGVNNQLDDDDLSLIAENTGQQTVKHRLRRKNKDFLDEDSDREDYKGKSGYLNDEYDDEEDGWLEDDYMKDNEFHMNDMWNSIAECFGDVELVINILKNIKPNFYDYQNDEDRFDESPDKTEKMHKLSTLTHIAEPDEIIREYLTAEDEVICNADVPERLSLAYGNRQLPVEPREIVTESAWILRILYKQFSEELLFEKISRDYMDLFGQDVTISNQVEKEIKSKVELVLMWLLNYKFEPAYIVSQKSHLFSPPLTEAMIWKIYDLDLEWYRLTTTLNELRSTISAREISDLPFEINNLLNNFNDFTDLEDVKYFLSIYHPQIENLHALETGVDKNFELEDDAAKKSTANKDYISVDRDDIFGEEQVDDDDENDSNFTLGEGDSSNGEGDPDSERPRAENDGKAVDAVKTKIARPSETISGLNTISTIKINNLHESWNEYFPSPFDFARVLLKGIESSQSAGADGENFYINQIECTKEWDKIITNYDTNSLNASYLGEIPPNTENISSLVEEWCKQFQSGPFNSGRKVLDALVTYYSKHLVTNPIIRSFLRELFIKYASVTTITTPLGENLIDPSSPDWIPSRLLKIPVQTLLNASKINYKYPKNVIGMCHRLDNLKEQLSNTTLGYMYLQVLSLKEKGLIEVVIHPLVDSEGVYWNTQRYGTRLKQWKERYQTGEGGLSGPLRQEYEDGKSLIDREHFAFVEADKSDAKWRENITDQFSAVYRSFFTRKFGGEKILPVLFYIQDKIIKRMLRELLIKFGREASDKLIQSAQNMVISYSKMMLSWYFDMDADKFFQQHNPGLSLKRQNLASAISNERGLFITFVDSNGFYIQHFCYYFITGNARGDSSIHYTDSSSANFQLEINDIVEKMLQHNVLMLLVGITNVNSYNLYKILSEKLSSRLLNGDKQFIVEIVPTQVPQIYVSSDRCKKEFGSQYSLPVLISISLIRYFQSPASEIVNLWDQGPANHLLELPMHPLQELVPKNKLLKALEMQCVAEVSKCGVSLAEIADRHHSAILQFVPGLGPRKAQVILQAIAKGLASRDSLKPNNSEVAVKGVGPCVYENCSSFIRDPMEQSVDMPSQQTTSLANNDSSVPSCEWYRIYDKSTFEFSRIHPKDYRLAKKMVNWASSRDENALESADMEAFVEDCYEKTDKFARLRGINHLKMIRDELLHPYLSLASAYDSLNYENIFYACLNENPLTFKHGSSVHCKIESVNEVGIRGKIYPSGITAVVNDYRQLRSLMSNYRQIESIVGEQLPSRISKIEYRPRIEADVFSFRVEVVVTTQMVKRILYGFYERLSELGIREFVSPLCLFDATVLKRWPFFEIDPFLKPKIQYKRIIRHPMYRAWPVKKAIAYLRQEQIGIGKPCFLPLPQSDRLNLVMKTCSEPFNCVCFTIHESNQRSPGELGRELMINGESFMSLDQIIAQLCDTLKLNLEEIYSHPRYRSNCDLAKVERELLQECAMKPDSISWAICPPDPNRRASPGGAARANHPLRFSLVVVPPGAMIKSIPTIKDSIYVSHKKFTLWTHSENTLKSLLNWWKESGYWDRNAQLELYNNQKMKKIGMANPPNAMQLNRQMGGHQQTHQRPQYHHQYPPHYQRVPPQNWDYGHQNY